MISATLDFVLAVGGLAATALVAVAHENSAAAASVMKIRNIATYFFSTIL